MKLKHDINYTYRSDMVELSNLPFIFPILEKIRIVSRKSFGYNFFFFHFYKSEYILLKSLKVMFWHKISQIKTRRFKVIGKVIPSSSIRNWNKARASSSFLWCDNIIASYELNRYSNLHRTWSSWELVGHYPPASYQESTH